MIPYELITQGQHLMRICNSCRYCEGYCAVWRAMEYRREFPEGDLTYLANLCHDCGECYYACQYAPPHEWAINAPLTFARIRTCSYEKHAWPKGIASAFRANGLVVALVTALTLVAFISGLLLAQGSQALTASVPGGDFYRLTSHNFLVATFGIAAVFSLMVLCVGVMRFCRDVGEKASDLLRPAILLKAIKEALSLKYLDSDGLGCTYPHDENSQFRRWFHHLTFYGFLLCFAATTAGAIYDFVFHWKAPYGYLSLPVLLGASGGIGLLIGPLGLLAMKFRRNRDISDDNHAGMDSAFLILLVLISLSGLLLLLLRQTAAMGTMLAIHLGVVMALFLTAPYAKFVHGLYRLLALAKYALERERKQTIGV